MNFSWINGRTVLTCEYHLITSQLDFVENLVPAGFCFSFLKNNIKVLLYLCLLTFEWSNQRSYSGLATFLKNSSLHHLGRCSKWKETCLFTLVSHIPCICKQILVMSRVYYTHVLTLTIPSLLPLVRPVWLLCCWVAWLSLGREPQCWLGAGRLTGRSADVLRQVVGLDSRLDAN